MNEYGTHEENGLWCGFMVRKKDIKNSPDNPEDAMLYCLEHFAQSRRKKQQEKFLMILGVW